MGSLPAGRDARSGLGRKLSMRRGATCTSAATSQGAGVPRWTTDRARFRGKVLFRLVLGTSTISSIIPLSGWRSLARPCRRPPASHPVPSHWSQQWTSSGSIIVVGRYGPASKVMIPNVGATFFTAGRPAWGLRSLVLNMAMELMGDQLMSPIRARSTCRMVLMGASSPLYSRLPKVMFVAPESCHHDGPRHMQALADGLIPSAPSVCQFIHRTLQESKNVRGPGCSCGPSSETRGGRRPAV